MAATVAMVGAETVAAEPDDGPFLRWTFCCSIAAKKNRIALVRHHRRLILLVHPVKALRHHEDLGGCPAEDDDAIGGGKG